ncbi:hypothetical protein LCM10_07595 [Rossellomorea aquimaris]|uniref:hypothetical protein n=1 Tax=Rossellomorea aquimaris TaxID=189382 RepID=UPI001CD4E63F|nr:hypothetical protein [Rossellomorea aquimaris]MCA1054849.1 hypothetical protein [Rossellomorea aquimaris]
MKRLFIFFGIIILLYSVYYDLNKGTLRLLMDEASMVTAQPQPQSIRKETVDSVPSSGHEDPSLPYIEIKIQPGDTVLSLVEDSLEGSLPVSIEQVVTDFEELNSVPPGKIQIGKIYKIPDYNE